MAKICVVVLAHILVSCGAHELRAQSVSSSRTPRTGVLVLRNGQVLSGVVSRSGDRYRVALGTSGEVRLPAHEVERFCVDLREAYLWKSRALRSDSWTAHLSLAEWCLRNELYAETAEQLIEARDGAGSPAAIDRVERRLLVAAALPVERTSSTVAAASEGIPSDGHGTAVSPEIAAPPEIAPWIMEKFTQRVQPLLLNGCAVSTCHGGRSTAEFQLQRSPKGGALTQRISQKNLHATLRFIDRHQPAESPLLLYARRPHGNSSVFQRESSTSPLGRLDDERHWKLLLSWVNMLAGASADAQPLATTSPPADRDQDAREASFSTDEAGPEGDGSQTAQPRVPLADDKPADDKLDEKSSPLATDKGPQRGASVETFQPLDAFDPEIFNRKFHGPSGQPAANAP